RRHRRPRCERRRAALRCRREHGGHALARARRRGHRDHDARPGEREPRGAVPPPHRGRRRAAGAGGGRGMSGVAIVYKWELLKLKAQKRTYLGLGAAMLVPIIFVVALAVKGQGGPNDIPIGRYIRDTGLATPFVVLFFMSIWAFPLITALVAG